MREGVRAAHAVDAPDEAPEPFERLLVLEIGGAAAAAREHREAEAFALVQRRAGEGERRHDRNLRGG